MNEYEFNLVRDEDGQLRMCQETPKVSNYGNYWISLHDVLLDSNDFPEIRFETGITRVKITVNIIPDDPETGNEVGGGDAVDTGQIEEEVNLPG